MSRRPHPHPSGPPGPPGPRHIPPGPPGPRPRHIPHPPGLHRPDRLGPWSYYWPSVFSYPGVLYPSIKDPYFGGVEEESLPPLPKHWIGKTLVRTGQKPLELILDSQNRNSQNWNLKKYVFEDTLKVPYLVLGPEDISNDYVKGRLTIYITKSGVIENVTYG